MYLATKYELALVVYDQKSLDDLSNRPGMQNSFDIQIQYGQLLPVHWQRQISGALAKEYTILTYAGTGTTNQSFNSIDK